jgi:hypothetical protein
MFKLNHCLHDFTKWKSAVTGLVAYFDFGVFYFSQLQGDAICFAVSSASDFVLLALVLESRNDRGLAPRYTDCFRSCLTDSLFHVRCAGAVSSHVDVMSGVQQDVLGCFY